ISIPIILCLKRKKETFRYISVKDGIGIVGMSWIIISLWGAIPFLLSHSVNNYTDAVFETVSGFTTTGASIFSDVESLSRGILFWRSLTHWLGGLGIIVLFVALIPNVSTTSFALCSLETTGIGSDKAKPRIKDTAIVLWKIYVLLTIASVAILVYLGMPLFDSICHAFGAIATGGYSTKNASIGAYGANIQWAITVIMILGGINFSLHYFLVKGNFGKVFKDEEFKWYFVLLAVCSLLIAVILKNSSITLSPLRDSIFQVVSLMTATGYATTDFNIWPQSTKGIILFIMFIGGCAGSTSGGLKVSRFLLIIKQVFRSIVKMIYPNSIQPIRFNAATLSEKIVLSVMAYFVIYLGLWCFGSLILLATESCGIITAISASISALSSVGPGLDAVGPTQNYAWMTMWGKWTLIFLMLAGRLEVYAFVCLFLPVTWKK
ncbi:MAG: TrkH family potassium uptake protein, partial [Candidatus Omnitrophica bacterium]|nr:TrkH family potassium uptake protein [Candidatus Omnitrophota bacterium]